MKLVNMLTVSKTVAADINRLTTKLTYLLYVSGGLGKNIDLMATLTWEDLPKECVK